MPTTTIDLPDYAGVLWQPARYIVLYGGRGGAKSWSTARALVIQAAQVPLRILCAREIQKSIQDSVHRLLTDQIGALGIPGYETTRGEIRHANGSLFLFEGLRHNVTKIKSLEGIDVAWVEEAERISEESWNVLIPTVRKAGSRILVTFNPDQDTDPSYRRFVLEPPPDTIARRVSWQDNPWLSDELIAEKDYLYRVDPDAAAHVWGGECRQATDAQILKGKWTVEEFEPTRSGPAAWDGPYHGADFGFAQDPTTLVRCWIHDRRLFIERESYGVGLELDHTAVKWKRDVPGCEDYVVRADSARPESISYLRRHGVPRIEGAPKWKGSVEDGIAHLRQYEQIVIHPRCTHAADEARHWSYKVDKRTGDVLPQAADGHEHLWDAARYALAPMIRQPSRLERAASATYYTV
ncbi:MAG TPA: PBSX family phage terminase large subunit [Longimicrobiaceae bacterium]|nr:PBSX family phage terminase large subunit [Longimicrobiaceae bacterium]